MDDIAEMKVKLDENGEVIAIEIINPGEGYKGKPVLTEWEKAILGDDQWK
jgi:uncharacterized protein YuzE